ncbi:hypothetical protein KFE25_000297 [Diacronema lutheri]|uniref:Uncharacterized protein n=2 Tax=Diacronema lutheri TaxID=2081491 RepID=A0A8J5XH30_DIALT|nr:hypothetical protein KFE25_000297 [Diacronema lutheri]
MQALVVALLAASAPLIPMPAKEEAANTLFTFMFASSQACQNRMTPISVTFNNPSCQVGVPEPNVGRVTTCENNVAMYQTLEVVDGECNSNQLSAANETLQTCDDSYGDVITRTCGDDALVDQYNPWVFPERVHSVEIVFESNTLCQGEPTQLSFISAGVCVPAPPDSSGVSAYTGARGTYQLFDVPDCAGSQATSGVRPVEKCVVNSEDNTSSIVVNVWTCPDGCVHDFATIGIENYHHSRRSMRRRLLFGNFMPKDSGDRIPVDCPQHCMPMASE